MPLLSKVLGKCTFHLLDLPRLEFFAICNGGITINKGNDFRPSSKVRFTEGK